MEGIGIWKLLNYGSKYVQETEYCATIHYCITIHLYLILFTENLTLVCKNLGTDWNLKIIKLYYENITQFIYVQSSYKWIFYSKYIQEYYTTIYYCITIHLCITSKRNFTENSTLICKNYTTSWHELEFIENYQIADHNISKYIHLTIRFLNSSRKRIIPFSRIFSQQLPPPLFPPQNS